MSNSTTVTAGSEAVDPSAGYEWWRFVLIVGLSLLSAVFSGLNLGIIGLDPGYLELLTMGPFETKEDERDAAYARRILPLRKRGNLLICTILLGNVSVNAILSIVMADMTSGLAGTLITTGIVMIFGEILPQAICSRYALLIGAHTMWILYIFVIITFPISFPLSAVLDKVLGEDAGNVYNKNKMKRLFELYEKEKLLDP
jgi:metal transporter CNNM